MLQVMGDSVSVVSEPCIHISINVYKCQWYRVTARIHLVIYIDARGYKTPGGKLRIYVGNKNHPRKGVVGIAIWWVLEDSNLSPPQRQCGALAK